MRILILVLTLAIGLPALSAGDARSYYREFQSQNRRLEMKKLRYLEAVVRGTDIRRITRYREMVVEQLSDSRNELSRVGGFEGDSTLWKEYMRAFDLYEQAFVEGFKDAEGLIKTRYANYDSLKAYYAILTEAEITMLDAAYVIEEAEKYFGKIHRVEVAVNEENRSKMNQLNVLSVHTREVGLAFYRVRAAVSGFIEATQSEEHAATDTLMTLVREIQKSTALSRQDQKAMNEFEEDDLSDFLSYYLDEMEEVIEDLRELAGKLGNKFLEEDAYEEAQKELAKFVDWQEEELSDYRETQNALVDDFLEE